MVSWFYESIFSFRKPGLSRHTGFTSPWQQPTFFLSPFLSPSLESSAFLSASSVTSFFPSSLLGESCRQKAVWRLRGGRVHNKHGRGADRGQTTITTTNNEKATDMRGPHPWGLIDDKSSTSHHRALRHWGWDKMAAIMQTTFSNLFSWMKMYEFCLRFQWNLFPRSELTIFQHWFG